MTDDDVAAWRVAHAADVCVCGHDRGAHYGPGGGQGACRAVCKCWTFHLDD